MGQEGGAEDLGGGPEGVVVPGEGVEGPCTDPPSTQLLICVPTEPTDVCAYTTPKTLHGSSIETPFVFINQ